MDQETEAPLDDLEAIEEVDEGDLGDARSTVTDAFGAGYGGAVMKNCTIGC